MSVFYTACLLGVILGLFMAWTSFQTRRRRNAKPPVTVAEFDAMRAKLVSLNVAPLPIRGRLNRS